MKKLNVPNTITLIRICMIPLFMVMILPLPTAWESLGGFGVFVSSFNDFVNAYGTYVAAAIFIVASLTDAVDGYIARSTKQVTNMGKFLDPIADKMLVTAALLVLVQLGRISSWAAVIIIGREFIVTGFRLIAASDGLVIAASIWGKIKTITQMIAIIFALLDNFPISAIPGLEAFPLYDIVLLLALVATIYSGVDYVVKNIHVLNNDSN